MNPQPAREIVRRPGHPSFGTLTAPHGRPLTSLPSHPLPCRRIYRSPWVLVRRINPKERYGRWSVGAYHISNGRRIASGSHRMLSFQISSLHFNQRRCMATAVSLITLSKQPAAYSVTRAG